MKRFVILGFLLIIAMMLVACSGGPSANSTPGAGSSSTETAVGNETGNGMTGTESSLGTTVVGSTTGTETTSGMVNTPAVSVTATLTEAAVPTSLGTTTTGSVSGTAVATPSGFGGVPVTGTNTSMKMIRVSQLIGFTVVDNSGTQLGTVEDLVLDLTNASVCGSTSGSAYGTVGSTPTVTSSVMATPSVSATTSISTPSGTTAGSPSSISNCPATGSQMNGQVSYVVVHTSGAVNETASSSSLATATPQVNVTGTATVESNTTATTSVKGELMPIPWNVVSIDLTNRQVVVHIAASSLSDAPSFKDSSWPDLMGSEWSTRLNTFWSGVNTGSTNNMASPTGTPTP